MNLTGANSSVWADGHPRLIVSADMYEELRARADREPWRQMKEQVEECTLLTYRAAGSYYDKLYSMSKVMRRAALACILFPEKQREYVHYIKNQMQHWQEINQSRLEQPLADWASMIAGGDAFFLSVIALDIIYNELTEEERTDIEALLRVWYEFERDRGRGSWYLAKYGAMGLWALYVGDQQLFEEYASAYDKRLRQHFTADGVALVGGNYASARLAAGELAKTYFMDVLTFNGWYDYYADSLLGDFYEWFYGGMVTPTKHYAIFQDCRETRHSGTGGYAANYRAYRFSQRAASSAAWFAPAPPEPGILTYVLMQEKLPASTAPRSRLWPSGYATLWENDVHQRSVMGALWAPNRRFSHDHFEVNAIHITGYGQTLVRNSGYEGWGRPVPGFSWDYVSKFDVRPEWDYAVSGNIVYLDRDAPHLLKNGDGLEEGLLHPAVDYACGRSGQAVKGGVHRRSLLLVKEQAAGATPYFLLFDEMTRRDSSRASMRVALHPPSMDDEVVEPQQTYRWAFADSVFLTIFLATPAGEGTRFKAGGLSQMERPPHYLHAEYEFAGEGTQALTVLYPHEGRSSCPAMQRLAGGNYAGIRIEHGKDLVDVALAATDGGEVQWRGVRLQGRVGLLRLNRETVNFYFVRQGRGLQSSAPVSFQARAAVSVIFQGRRGQIVSPGTEVTFITEEQEPQCRLGGLVVDALSRAPGRVTVHVPPGTHEIEFDEVGGLD